MREIKSLTSLRGIAAFAVVLQHFSTAAQTLTPQWIPSLAPHGYMAVDFFFVLSGFIMSLTYLPSFEASGIRAFPDFMLKRVARIVPLNVFVLLALMAAGMLSHAIGGVNIFFDDSTVAFDLPANLLMLQGLGIGKNLNGPSWSISTEFAAYFLFPLFVMLVFNRRRIVSATALFMALAILCALASRHPKLGLGTEGIADQLVRCFTEFVLGMGAFIMFRFRNSSGGSASDLETGLLFAASAVGLILGIDLPVALLFPFLVVAAALNRGRIARALSGGVPYFMGLVSFSIYLVHFPFRPPALRLFSAIHPGPASAVTALAFALVGSLAIIPFAWLTYVGIERPGRRIVRRWADGARSRGLVASPPGD